MLFLMTPIRRPDAHSLHIRARQIHELTSKIYHRLPAPLAPRIVVSFAAAFNSGQKSPLPKLLLERLLTTAVFYSEHTKATLPTAFNSFSIVCRFIIFLQLLYPCNYHILQLTLRTQVGRILKIFRSKNLSLQASTPSSAKTPLIRQSARSLVQTQTVRTHHCRCQHSGSSRRVENTSSHLHSRLSRGGLQRP